MKKPTPLAGTEQVMHHGRWVNALTLPNFDAKKRYRWRNTPSARQPVVRIEKFTVPVPTMHEPSRKRHYFRLLAANSEIIAASESYNTARARNATALLLSRAELVVV